MTRWSGYAGKRCFVTVAASGIGRATVLKLAQQGAVLYLTLGHCRGHYDLQPLAEWWPTVDRCAWDLPVFYTLLRRGLAWAKAH